MALCHRNTGFELTGFMALPSKNNQLLHSEMKYSAMCEKAIVNEKGDIIVYQLICDISNDPQWQP